MSAAAAAGGGRGSGVTPRGLPASNSRPNRFALRSSAPAQLRAQAESEAQRMKELEQQQKLQAQRLAKSAQAPAPLQGASKWLKKKTPTLSADSASKAPTSPRKLAPSFNKAPPGIPPAGAPLSPKLTGEQVGRHQPQRITITSPPLVSDEDDSDASTSDAGSDALGRRRRASKNARRSTQRDSIERLRNRSHSSSPVAAEAAGG